MSTDYVPSREDRFSFGIWTVGWQGVDVFGGAVRPPMPTDAGRLGDLIGRVSPEEQWGIDEALLAVLGLR